jgi:hypothetical protein
MSVATSCARCDVVWRDCRANRAPKLRCNLWREGRRGAWKIRIFRIKPVGRLDKLSTPLHTNINPIFCLPSLSRAILMFHCIVRRNRNLSLSIIQLVTKWNLRVKFIYSVKQGTSYFMQATLRKKTPLYEYVWISQRRMNMGCIKT